MGILSNTQSAHMTLICETIHEHMKILPKYMLKMSLRANTNINKHNGTLPNKKKKKI